MFNDEKRSHFCSSLSYYSVEVLGIVSVQLHFNQIVMAEKVFLP